MYRARVHISRVRMYASPCARITRAARIRARARLPSPREIRIVVGSNNDEDDENEDGSRRETGAGLPTPLPFFFVFFSSAPFFCQPTSSRPRGESTEGYPRPCSNRLVSSSLRAPLRLSLVPRVPGTPSSPPFSLSLALCLFLPFSLLRRLRRMPGSEVTQKIFIDSEGDA